jgi:hypothetical protein
MKRTHTAQTALTLILAALCFLSCSACNKIGVASGEEYLGRWTDNTSYFQAGYGKVDHIEITRNAGNFLVTIGPRTIPANLKDGTLHLEGTLESTGLTYVKDSDTLISADRVYHRVR